MDYLTIKKLLSSTSQRRGPLVILRRMEDEPKRSLKSVKKRTKSRSLKSSRRLLNQGKTPSLSNTTNISELPECSCAMCGMPTASRNLSEDVLEFDLLLSYFHSECEELCQISLYCKDCLSVLTRLRVLDATLSKLRDELEGVVGTVKAAFRLRKTRGTGNPPSPKKRCVTNEGESSSRIEVEPIKSSPGNICSDNEDSFDIASFDFGEIDEKPIIVNDELDISSSQEDDSIAFSPEGESDGDLMDDGTNNENPADSEIAVIKKRFTCPECTKSYAYDHGLKRHMRIHKKQNSKRSVNTVNDDDEKNNDAAESSNKQSHSSCLKENDYACPVCNASFETDVKFKEHASSCHKAVAEVGNVYKCEQCQQEFARFAKLKSHEAVAHPVESTENEDEVQTQLEHRNSPAKKASDSELGDSDEGSDTDSRRRPTSKHTIKRVRRRVLECRIKCVDCGNQYWKWEELKRHFQEQHLSTLEDCDDPFVYKCPKCPLFGVKHDIISHHVKEEHPDACAQGFLMSKGSDNFVFNLTSWTGSVASARRPLGTTLSCTEDAEIVANDESCKTGLKESSDGNKANVPDISEPLEQGSTCKSLSEAAFTNQETEGEEKRKVTEPLRDGVAEDTQSNYVPTEESESSDTEGSAEEELIERPTVRPSKYQRKTPKVKNIFSCSICKLDCFGETALQQHFKQTHPDKGHPFSCTMCEFTAQFVITVEQHVKREHIQESDFICDVCGQSFFLKTAFEAHVKTHKEKEEKCPDCEETFPNSAEMKEHYRVVHEGLKPRQFICTTCPAYFEKKKQLQRHKSKFHPQGDWKPKRCETCKRLFRFKIRYETHFHVGDRIHYQCAHCGKKCCAWHLMEDHILKHHEGKPQKRKRFKTQCEQCGIVVLKSHLKTHILVNHSENPEERRTCKECNQTFPSFTAKQRHDKEVHSGEGLISCYFCPKTFARAFQLQNHMRRHTMEGLACPICNKLMSQEGVLKKHMATVCGVDEEKREKLRKKKREEMAKFREKKVYKCEKCGARFSQKPMLVSHQKKCF